ncbi:MAG: YdcF family protein [Magnetococcus sp. YQC-9]
MSILAWMVFGNAFVVDPLLAGLEKRYPPYNAQAGVDPEYVVVLGGGVIADPSIPVTAQLGRESMMRLVEGMRIVGLHPQSRLLLSGGAPIGDVAEALGMARVALDLGLSSDRIRIEDGSLDTADQARLIHGMIGEARFVLVTSAVHMPRSMALFGKQGMEPIPGPTGHRLRGTDTLQERIFGIIALENIQNAHVVVHEYLGMAWSAWRGSL